MLLTLAASFEPSLREVFRTWETGPPRAEILVVTWVEAPVPLFDMMYLDLLYSDKSALNMGMEEAMMVTAISTVPHMTRSVPKT